MSRVRRVVVDPQKPESIVEQMTELMEVLDGRVEFGDPNSGLDHTDTTLAGASNAAHPGNPLNILGSFVEVSLQTCDDATGQAVTCYHNLDLDVPNLSAGDFNVRWFVMGVQHDLTGAGAGMSFSVFADSDQTVTKDAVVLTFKTETLTVDGDHPVKVTLFFVPATT